jgi:hypothetical protein
MTGRNSIPLISLISHLTFQSFPVFSQANLIERKWRQCTSAPLKN